MINIVIIINSLLDNYKLKKQAILEPHSKVSMITQ